MRVTPNKNRNPALTEDIRLMISEGTSIHKIGDDLVDSLSRDLSTLLNNVSKIKKADDIKKFFKAIEVFRNRLDLILNPNYAYFQKIKINNTPLHNLFYKLKKSDQIKRFAALYEKSLNYLVTELNSKPTWISKSQDDAIYAEYSWEQDKDEWKKRVQIKARNLWKDLKNAFHVFDLEGKHIGVPNEEVEEIHGHPVLILGYDPDDKKHSILMESVAQAIKKAKEAVAKRFPTLLPRSLLIIINFDMKLGVGGIYRRYFDKDTSAIEISPILGKPTKIQTTIIHEAAHHYWKYRLSEDARQFWTKVYKANMTGHLDLKKLKKYWDENPDMESIRQVMKDTSMKVKDPQLYLQLHYLVGNYHIQQILGSSPAYKISHPDQGFTIKNREDLEKAIKNKKVWIVPKQPVTGYAGNNAEEMFTESVATYLVYGPRAMPDYILSMLKHVIGSPLKESYLNSLEEINK